MENDRDYDLPELFGFIVEELEADLPHNWGRIMLDAKVSSEGGKQSISVITYHATEQSSEPMRFVATNAIGTMNAVLRINKIMSANGDVWSSARFVMGRDGTVNIQTDTKTNSEKEDQ